MLSKLLPAFQRIQALELKKRLGEPRRFIQVVAGPRQVGKTTLVRQVTTALDRPVNSVSADEPSLRGPAWLQLQWDQAREAARDARGGILVVDEAHKLPHWSETVKRLWDEDTAEGLPLYVVLLGSAPLLIRRGLTESLAGRFEIIHLPHWSFSEMREAFGWSLDQFVFFGGYPGAAPLIGDIERWRRYMLDSLIETTISRDVLLLTRVDKPALLRQLFELACRYSGQILSYTKMLGQLQDAGNSTTLAHYMDLLSGAGMVTALRKYSGAVTRHRGSIPKLQVHNTGLISAFSALTLDEARADGDQWGRLVESAVGAHLANEAATGAGSLFYWRDRNREVDFVFQNGTSLTAIEVKSGVASLAQPGLDAFTSEYKHSRSLLVGGDGIALEEFLLHIAPRTLRSAKT
jgi:predicted AAA+ superfamily ATPase